jgi:CRISPR-associated protein Cmr3
MAWTYVDIRGVDPLLFRDGRPFTAAAGGLTAQSLPLPLPTTVAAFVRAQIGRANAWDWASRDVCERAHGVPVHGPLLLRDGEIVLPAPGDALLARSAGVAGPSSATRDDGYVSDSGAPPRIHRLVPSEEDAASCDLPDGMWPLVRELETRGDRPTGDTALPGKPPRDFNYWPRSAMMQWLQKSVPENLPQIGGLPEEERIGIQMEPGTDKTQRGMLYAARLRAFGERTETGRHCYTLMSHVNLPDGDDFLRAGTLGGERRITIIEPIPREKVASIWPHCPPELKHALKSAKRVRMILATPAHFEHGWKPGWIGKSGTSEVHLPAGLSKVGLELVGAAVGPRIPVSGWRLRPPTGPRPIRWLAPAGSVYFFRVTGGSPEALYEDAWMKPVSDNEQDRRDGLGLALWGTW